MGSTDVTNCENACPKTYEQIPEPPEPKENYKRFSLLEQKPSVNGQVYAGWCVGDEFLVSRKTICEDGTTNVNSAAFEFNHEVDASNKQCSERKCSAGSGNTNPWTPSYCMVHTKNTGEKCNYHHTAEINGASTNLLLAGTCVNGECQPDEFPTPASCPDGYKIMTEGNNILYHEFNNDADGCKAEGEFASGRQPQNRNRCGKTDGTSPNFSCGHLPRANKASATMYTHSFENWPTGDNTINSEWGYTVSKIDRFFWFMMFTTDPIYPIVDTLPDATESYPDQTLKDIEITVGTDDKINYRGRALVCDPDMTDLYIEDYGCLIDSFGDYSYQGSEITFYGFSNETTRIRHFQAQPLLAVSMPILLCGSVATRNCLGSVDFKYERSTSAEELCNHKYTRCQEVTASPTAEPTPATSHGDPIIWTFHEECYDLNKDGLYGATVNPKFSHDVKIGVYNDFMRELVVVDRKDNVWLSINSLGEHVVDEKFPYAFSYEEKPCPEEMKESECQGTYKEWVFDAQEFRYTVHLLRHNYKDAGIPEGDLGYHLDIYPKPYKRFFEDGHFESYSGLFFENPLPEELEYCPGGSQRNQAKQ